MPTPSIKKQDQAKLAKVLLLGASCDNCAYKTRRLDDEYSDLAQYINVCVCVQNTVLSIPGREADIARHVPCPEENVCQYWRKENE